MFKTIFGKQIFLYVTIFTISLTALGSVLSRVYSSFFYERQERALVEQGGRISRLISNYIVSDWDGSPRFIINPLNLQRISGEVGVLNEYLESSFIFTGSDFSIVLRTKDIDEEVEKVDTESVPEIKKALMGEIVSFEGNMGGIYPESKFTVAYPIMVQRGGQRADEAAGIIFMSSSLNMLKASISEIMKITTISVLVSCCVSYFFIYLSSLGITRPLRQMNEAAKVIASGDFEKRIEVKSQDEVGQLAESFNNMAMSLDAQEKSRREFLASVSHDLRSPLTSITGFLQAIIDGAVPVEKQSYYLGIILDECNRLSKLTGDLLDISKLQFVGDVELYCEEFDINSMIRETLAQFENRIKSKNIGLKILFWSEKDMVVADYEKIKRVFYNLVDNALKFTPPEGMIKVETTAREGKVYISVKDSGEGIDEESIKHIFDRFYKADKSRGKDKTGSGLGLSIVKEFIKAHDEKIHVNSKPGQGSEFIFTLKQST